MVITLEQRISRLSEFYDTKVLYRTYQYGKDKGYNLPELFSYLYGQVVTDYIILDSYGRELPLLSSYIISYKQWRQDMSG